MQQLVPLFGIVGALGVGVVSPGPSFVMVARVAAARSRAHGVASGLGMGVGGMTFAATALAGLQAVLLAVPALDVALQVVGGLYLAWLGVRIFRGAAAPLDVTSGGEQQASTLARSFAMALATQLSNPKTAIVYASVFAAFLPASFSAGFAAAVLVIIFAMETSWYVLVALVLSSAGPRRAYLRAKTWIDRLAGTVMVGLGAKLLTSVMR